MRGWVARGGPSEGVSEVALPTTSENEPARWSRRGLGVSAANVAILVVVVSAGWLLFGFSDRARLHHDVALTTSRLSTVIEDLDATEWQVRSSGVLTSALDTEIRGDVVEADGLLARVSADAVVAARVEPEFRVYRDAVSAEL